MKTLRVLAIAVCPLIMVSLISCSTSLPPKPEVLRGQTVYFEHYTFLTWKNGLRLLVIDNFPGPISSKSDFKLGDEAPYVFSEVVKSNQIEMTWMLRTRDGKTGEFKLNKADYDLSKGCVFVAKKADDGVVVKQIDADVSKLELDEEVINKFLETIVSRKQQIEIK